MTRTGVPRLLSALVVSGVALVTMTGCFGPPPPTIVNRYISAVSVPEDAGAEAVVVGSQLGAGTADGPALTVGESATVVNGGSIQQSITSSEAFSILRIAVEEFVVETPAAQALGAGAVEAEPDPESTGAPGFGYYELTLSAPVTEATIVLTVPQALPGDRFLTYFAAVDAGGAQGAPSAQSVEAVTVGTGDVQVSVSWDVDSDLDLHVVEPGGEEIYWDAPASSTGGTLDLDSNAGCAIDGVRNENVTWATGDAPAGEYKVLIDLWDACAVQPTNYVVTVTVVGGVTETYTGSIDGPGDQGGPGAGELVTTFDVAESD